MRVRIRRTLNTEPFIHMCPGNQCAICNWKRRKSAMKTWANVLECKSGRNGNSRYAPNRNLASDPRGGHG